jgi:Fe(3+) dicitrate transport protein
MTLRGFSVAIFIVAAMSSFAQYQLTGIVNSMDSATVVKDCIVYLNDGSRSAITDGRGRFLFNDLASGNYSIHFTSETFKYKSMTVLIAGQDVSLVVHLQPRTEQLNEVTISDASTAFGFTKMRAVESMGIYEGKKSEVIIPEQLFANLSTNNARQVYSRVAGLNIWENDGAGLQLSIGGRGLDPNRTSNFNTRQNGYDISADALGYPESYYTPPVEALGKIQIIRGAASLQYGTQFGGLINFIMKKPVTDKKLELTARQTAGSFGFTNSFVSGSGTNKKLSYYSFVQYKQGNGWRSNSNFTNHTVFANVNYAFSDRAKLGLDLTQMGYLSQQPGGLSDQMFRENPRQSNRERNWFQVNWNLGALHFDYKLNSTSDLNIRVFGLYANRNSIGFRPNRVATIDDNSERDLIKGDFKNWGSEVRLLKRYEISKIPSVLLIGTRYYHGFNHSTQGLGSASAKADFNYVESDDITYDYRFPNKNLSFFAENIFYVHDKVSITPGLRYEIIKTTASGYYGTIYKDLAGNIIERTKTNEQRTNTRSFLIAGIGVGYKPSNHTEIYSNISQNYRSITFSDMRISNPSQVIDPNMKDEKGYSFDLGIRSDQTTLFNYDVTAFYLNYNNRIGEVQFYDENNRVLRRRANIGQAIIQGVEAYGEVDVTRVALPAVNIPWSAVIFENIAFINSNYRRSETTGVVGNEVEFVPRWNMKSGLRLGYKNMKASFQYTHLSKQFTDATNATDGGVSAVIGIIPSYSIMDISLSYQFKKIRVEGSINNVANQFYFTRRATGYPGPGILPSDGRSFYVTLQVKI